MPHPSSADDRLSALDTEFLHLEDGVSHMHIGGVSVFDGTPPSREAVIGLLASKLDRIPRYRERLQPVPLEIGRPVWIDDERFELGYHVRRTALAEATDDELEVLVGRLMSQELDRDRPLWEVWIVHGLPQGRWALVSKVHHSMVDGVAGVGLLEALLDVDPETQPPPAADWTARPGPSGSTLVLDAWRGLIADTADRLGSLPRIARDPGGAIRCAAGVASGLLHLAQQVIPTTSRAIDGPIGPHRAWAHASVPLADIRQIRSVAGGTVNDVVLTAVAGGFRDLLLARGEAVDDVELRTLVPVSVRNGSDPVLDNHVSAILYDLPVHMADPAVRLHQVRLSMTAAKSSHMAEAGEAVTSMADLLPPIAIGLISRLAMRINRDHPQRTIDTVVTNVPGPQFPLFCLGRKMLEHRPFVPISHGIQIAVAILSYDGRLSFGITGDLRAAPDVAVIATGIVATVDELLLRTACSSGS